MPSTVVEDLEEDESPERPAYQGGRETRSSARKRAAEAEGHSPEEGGSAPVVPKKKSKRNNKSQRVLFQKKNNEDMPDDEEQVYVQRVSRCSEHLLIVLFCLPCE